MPYFDAVRGELGGRPSLSPGQANALLRAFFGVLGQESLGGLSGLLQRLRNQGMGRLAESWVGSGENLPITGDQIERIMESGRLQKVADQAGVDRQEAGARLAAILPGLVDNLTPSGREDRAHFDRAIARLLSTYGGLRGSLSASGSGLPGEGPASRRETP